MDEEKEVTEHLTDRTKEMIDNKILDSEGPKMRKKRNPQEERVEQQAFSNTGENWDREEIRYLLNNRKGMDNDEMKEFLQGQKEFQKEDVGQFTNSEEKFILQNHNAMDIEDIAERLDKSPRAVEMQLRIMGLGGEI